MSSANEHTTDDEQLPHEHMQERDRRTKGKKERVTVRIPKKRLDDIEQLVDDGEFPNRSEAMRTAIQKMLNKHNVTHPALR